MATPIPPNAAAFNVFDIAAATGGRVLREGDIASSTGVYSDSRSVVPGALYVALRGEHVDGHAFVAAALAAGARLFVVDGAHAADCLRSLPAAAAVVSVPDTVVAWGDLASAHLKRWHRTRLHDSPAVVAITGSAGKTTTKEICAALLGAIGPTWSTPGNLNNLVGLPATIFALTGQHAFLVLEMGMSVPGEIARLAAIARPNVGVLLNVGLGHAGGVGGSRGDVAREKGALFAALDAHQGWTVAIVNVDDPAARAQVLRQSVIREITFGRAESAAYRLVDRVITPRGSRITIVRSDKAALSVDLPLPGEAAAIDFVAALAAASVVAEMYGAEASFTSERVSSALEGLAVPSGRARMVRAGSIVVIDDTYNANPESFRAALATAAEIAAAERRRLVLVIGEMKELGEAGEDEHRKLGDAVGRMVPPPALLIGCGGCLVGRALDAASAGGVAVRAADDVSDAEGTVSQSVRPGDIILVKASRSVGAERVVARLFTEWESR